MSIDLREDVEEERLHVEIQRLVIEEEFCQETEVLAVQLNTIQCTGH